jgi:membrane protease YdiL (CAAX protease family)
MMPEPPPGPMPPMPELSPADAPVGSEVPGTGPKGLPAVDWSFGRALLVGLVTNIVLAQVVVAGLAFAVLGITSSDDPATVVAALVGDLAWLAFMVAWLQRWHPDWRARIGVTFGRSGARDAGFGVVAGLLLYPVIAFVVAIPLTILFSALSGSDATTPDQLPQNLSTAQAVASVLLAVIVAPIAEELFFRGVLFRSLRDRHGFWIGALVSAFVFGAVHYVPAAWQDTLLLQSIMVFTGVALAWIYERRGNLIATVAAHMAFNTVGIVLILWSR